MSKIRDLTGMKFGALKVLGFAGTKRTKEGTRAQWDCRCMCGNLVTRVLHGAKQASINSCSRSCRYVKKDVRVNRLWHTYLRNAKVANREFKITKKEFEQLITSPCIFGCMPDPYNGIDRVDNSKGYTSENCLPCCKEHNMMKGILSLERFRQLCKQVVEAEL